MVKEDKIRLANRSRHKRSKQRTGEFFSKVRYLGTRSGSWGKGAVCPGRLQLPVSEEGLSPPKCICLLGWSKYYRLGGLLTHQEFIFSQSRRLEVQDQSDLFLLRPLCLAYKWPYSSCVLMQPFFCSLPLLVRTPVLLDKGSPI